MLNRAIYRLPLLLVLLPFPLLAAVTSELDRHSLYQGEKLLLTLKIDRKFEQRPDLRALEKDFHLLGSKKTSLSSHATGSVQNATQWQLKLRAKTAGDITIPSIRFDAEFSPALEVTVLPAALNPAPEDTGLRQLFIEVETDQPRVYVGSQAILRVKIFHLNPLPLDSQLSNPVVRNALVKELEQRREYNTNLDGQNYYVTEYSYALFPRTAETVEVEPFVFHATMGNGETLELDSSLLLLNVLPQAFSSDNNIWLPAKSLYIEDNLNDLTVYDSPTPLLRIITLEAEGLPASSLPLLADLKNSAAEIKLTNVVLEEQVNDQGIVSRRMEELLITPKGQQEVLLPAITLPWWNSRLESTQTATIAARQISIGAATKASASPSSTAPDIEVKHGNQTLLIWLLTAITIIATLGCIYALYFLRQSKHNTAPAAPSNKHEHALQQLATDVAERNAFKAFAQACEHSNPEMARVRLIEWSQLFWNNTDINSVEEVCKLAENRTLNFLVLDMEQYLMTNPHLWQGDLLFDTVEKLRNRRKRIEAERSTDEVFQ